MKLAQFIDKIFDIFLPKKTSKSLRQFFKYLVCGGAATVSDMSVLFVLNYLLGINHLIAAGFGFGVGVATNYSLNKVLVFKSNGKVKKEFPLFVLIGLGGLAWTEFILWMLVDKFDLNVMLAKMVAVVLVLNWNFFMRKRFVFPAESNIENLEKSLQ
ncbi:MAG: GtrA family protein [Candidatus Moranbacteria bacterium]|nr:GtrA family protein [Candidatus Moranbacteria bacterium]